MVSCSNCSWKHKKRVVSAADSLRHNMWNVEIKETKLWEGEKKEATGSADPFSPSAFCLDTDKAGLESFPDRLSPARCPQHVLWMKLFHHDSLTITSSFSTIVPSLCHSLLHSFHNLTLIVSENFVLPPFFSLTDQIVPALWGCWITEGLDVSVIRLQGEWHHDFVVVVWFFRLFGWEVTS